MRVLPLVLALLVATPALAEDPEPEVAQQTAEAAEFAHPLRVRLDIDLPIIFSAALPGLVFASGLVAVDPAGYSPTREGLNPLDRSALDTFRPDVSTASDIAWLTLLTLPMIDHLVESAVSAKGDKRRFGRRFGTDFAIYTEALAINMLLTELLKYTAQRPRPLAYFDPADVQDGELRAELQEKQGQPDSAKSFLSGHTSFAFTSAAVWSMLWTLKDPTPRVALGLTWGLSFAGASAIGLLRIAAGKHHPTDVIAGALLGTTVGILTPLLHRRGAGVPLVIAPMAGDGVKGVMIVGLLP